MAIGDRIFNLAKSKVDDALNGGRGDENQFTPEELAAAHQASLVDQTQQATSKLVEEENKYLEYSAKLIEKLIVPISLEGKGVYFFSSQLDGTKTTEYENCLLTINPCNENKSTFDVTVEFQSTSLNPQISQKLDNLTYCISIGRDLAFINKDYPIFAKSYEETHELRKWLYQIEIEPLSTSELMGTFVQLGDDTSPKQIQYYNQTDYPADLEYFVALDNDGDKCVVKLRKDVAMATFELEKLNWKSFGTDYNYLELLRNKYEFDAALNQKFHKEGFGRGLRGIRIKRV